MAGEWQAPPEVLAALGRCALAAGRDTRSCAEGSCRLNTLELAGRGPLSRQRVELQLASGERCAADVGRMARTVRGAGLTQAEVGMLLGRSKQAIAQLERRALARLRKALRNLTRAPSANVPIRRRKRLPPR